MYLGEFLRIGQIVYSDGQKDVKQCVCVGVEEMLWQTKRELMVFQDKAVERKSTKERNASIFHHIPACSSLAVFTCYVKRVHLYVRQREHDGRIQLPKSVRTMKKMEKTIPLSFTPPWDLMPLYITMFQSSPVRIYRNTCSQREFIIQASSDQRHEDMSTIRALRSAISSNECR